MKILLLLYFVCMCLALSLEPEVPPEEGPEDLSGAKLPPVVEGPEVTPEEGPEVPLGSWVPLEEGPEVPPEEGPEDLSGAKLPSAEGPEVLLEPEVLPPVADEVPEDPHIDEEFPLEEDDKPIPEYRVMIQNDWRDDGLLKKLYELGVPPADAEKYADEWEAYVTPQGIKMLESGGVNFTRVDHDGEAALKGIWKEEGDGLGKYHTHEELVAFLTDLETRFPHLAEVFNIGKTVQNRDMLGMRIRVKADTRAKPQFKYIGNIHGDETVGRECLIRLIEDILTNYHTDADIKDLVDTTDIWILPSMNPDGFALGRRGNYRGVDLNRNFPDRFLGQRPIQEPEVKNVIQWSLANNFLLSANLHGGDLVANYPFDGNRRHASGVYTGCSDDRMFRELALSYSMAHPKMHLSRRFPKGITNGAAWYVLYGGLQDWNYLYTNDFGLTMELSYTKYPPASQIQGFWEDNKPALYAYLRMVHRGVKGHVVDGEGNPIPGAIISITEFTEDEGPVANRHYTHTQSNGWYFRLLPYGVWEITATGHGFESISIQISIEEGETSATVQDFALEREGDVSTSESLKVENASTLVHSESVDNHSEYDHSEYGEKEDAIN